MRIGARYSHLNGEEYLLVHRKQLWAEVQDVIAGVDAWACRTKVSRERTMKGRTLFSPPDMNQAFKDGLQARGWSERRKTFWVTADERLLRRIHGLPEDEQKDAIREAGHEPIMSYNQTDFVKDRVAVEVQFGKYAFVAHDLFVKHLSFYVSDVIDVGIEIRTGVGDRFIGDALDRFGRQVLVALTDRFDRLPEDRLAYRAIHEPRQVALLSARPRQIAPHESVRVVGDDEIPPVHRSHLHV